jgi:hypothetical protein
MGGLVEISDYVNQLIFGSFYILKLFDSRLLDRFCLENICFDY